MYFCASLYNLINNAPINPTPITAPETPQRLAPACIFSKGLPLLFETLPPEGGEVDVGATLCPWVDTGAGAAVGLGEARADDGASVPFGSSVDVVILPVLIVLGPMTMGTMTSSVLPSLSVVVRVNVVVTVLFRSPASVVL